MENLEILDLGVAENYKIKEIIRRQIPDSPPAKQDASELISRITALCVYLFNPSVFHSIIKLISPKKLPKCPLNVNHRLTHYEENLLGP